MGAVRNQLGYHTVFEVSDRFPDAVLGAVALGVLIVMIVLVARHGTRSLVQRFSWIWLGMAALIWLVLEARILGGFYGILTGAIAVIPTFVAVLAWRDGEIKPNEYLHVRARLVAPIAASAILVLMAYEGACQWRAFDLEGQLSAGHATIVTGTVQEVANWNWGTETFRVDGHVYSFDETAAYVGFHQTTSNWGPIHNGLNVRVASIGDAIVRLEIEDGQ
jgi:hypothetical protein